MDDGSEHTSFPIVNPRNRPAPYFAYAARKVWTSVLSEVNQRTVYIGQVGSHRSLTQFVRRLRRWYPNGIRVWHVKCTSSRRHDAYRNVNPCHDLKPCSCRRRRGQIQRVAVKCKNTNGTESLGFSIVGYLVPLGNKLSLWSFSRMGERQT